MNHLVVVAHPNASGYCVSLASAYQHTLEARGHHVIWTDLYRDPLTPVLSATEYQATRRGAYASELAAAHAHLRSMDALTLFFPLWWMGFPAVMKGWIDRVFSYGVAYEMDGERPIPLLEGRRCATVATMGTHTKDYVEDGAIPAMELLWRRHVFGFCGLELTSCLWLGNASLASDEERSRHREDVDALARGWNTAREAPSS